MRLKTIALIICLGTSVGVFTQNLNDIFEVERVTFEEQISQIDYESIQLASNDTQLAYVISSTTYRDSVKVYFYNFELDKKWIETYSYPKNFLFFVPVEKVTGITFDEDHIVLRYSDLRDYVCVFERKENKLLSVVPSFDRLNQMKLVNNQIYFAKHYNTDPRQSPYKVYIGKIDWRNYSLEAFETPSFEVIEFSHFAPNDWFDVNSKGISVFAQTVEYAITFYDVNIDSICTVNVKDDLWREVQSDSIVKALEGKQSAREVIFALEPFHNSTNRIQTVSFLNDSLLIISKIVEKQNEKNNLRLYDLIKMESTINGYRTVPIIQNVPDSELPEKSQITLDNYEFRIRSKPHLFQNNHLIFFDSHYAEIPWGKKKKVFNENNENEAIKNTPKKTFIVVARLRADLFK